MFRSYKLAGKRGFTLIEVTLAIVIGVIMIAGATLLYNQSKISSGNSRAQAKVLALAQLVEEYAANNAGTYPTMEPVRSLWKRKRPDDYLKSPWGGQLGTDLQESADAAAGGGADSGGTRGVAHNSTSTGRSPVNKTAGSKYTSSASPWAGNNNDCVVNPGNQCGTTAGINVLPNGNAPLKDQNKSGGLSYSLNDGGVGTAGADSQNNTETASIWDSVTNVTKVVRGYVVWAYDQQGQYPTFTAGGKPQ
jgi:prepilin-type N-terminal cleavage/methylation domain-containing protein